MGNNNLINQQDLKALADFNQQILDTAPCSIITIDKNGILTSVNKHFYNFSGSSSPLGRDVFKLPFFINEGLCEPLKKLLADGTPFNKINCRTVNSKGEIKYLNLIHVPLRGAGGEITGCLSMALDNSEVFETNKKLEAINSELENKVLARTEELNKINEDLNYALKLKAKFIADYSHELRTPLAVIMGNADLARMRLGEANTALANNLSLIKNQVEYIAGLLSDLTLLATMDSGVKKLEYQKIDLTGLLNKIVLALNVIAEQKNIAINFRNNFDDLEIGGDTRQLERLFTNILGNAIKYGRPNGLVNIWLENTAGAIKIHFEDNGLGIAERDLPYIFSRFYRADQAKMSGEAGSGLGLAICQKIAEAHQGEIIVKSQLDQGSTFTVRLPANIN